MQFQLRTASLIVFGDGEFGRAAELIAPWGKRLFLCTGGESLERGGHLTPLLSELTERGITVTRCIVRGEPEVSLIDEAAALCRAMACDGVLAVGGGSVLDAGKAVAALASQPEPSPIIEYLEDVGRGAPRALVANPLPLCAAPTTAGSGSEVTRNAVVRVPELGVKRSMRSDLMLPRIALVDPRLSKSAPRKVAAAAGLDALTHLIEGYVSRGAQPTTDLLARRGLEIMWQALSQLAQVPQEGSPSDEVAQNLALCSMWGGMVLANAGLGAVHGLVAPLGGVCSVAHGDGCACLLPATFRQNFGALLRRAPESLALRRYQEMASVLGVAEARDAEVVVEDAAARLSELRKNLGVPSLSAQGVTAEHFERILSGARGGSMRYNPVELRDDELLQILHASL